MVSKRFSMIFLWLFVYSAAMAYLESAVVVYLRWLYYPDGLTTTLNEMSMQALVVEIAREAATVVMLFAVAIMAGKNRIQRTAAFLFCFGVWDVFYYIWLKVLLDWPAGLLDWDVLFLIPTIWIGPVLAPVLVSFGLIGTGILIYHLNLQDKHVHAGWLEWCLMLTGCGIIFLSFIIQSGADLSDLSLIRYPWWIFFTGYIISLTGVIMMVSRVKTK
ncbi:hypothetical protein JW835_15745 [bacterium]|nr:hypothetical protein [bacterium]